MSTTVILSLGEMLEQVIQEDPGLGDLLAGRRVYLRKATPAAALNYIVLRGTTETPLRAGYYNGRGGHHNTEMLTSYARTLTTARRIYARLVQLLDGKRPVVVGHQVLRGTLEYLDDIEERAPDAGSQVDKAPVAWGVLAKYRVWSLEAA